MRGGLGQRDAAKSARRGSVVTTQNDELNDSFHGVQTTAESWTWSRKIQYSESTFAEEQGQTCLLESVVKFYLVFRTMFFKQDDDITRRVFP